ncbi:signal transduction histidine kinase [Elusimicrobium posterum]|uniref:HAMP domain-containing sensor histidine kinase n=1 Tax=Elusimicrobium posterum TaxID=3116653 RepID=UPI003C759A8E
MSIFKRLFRMFLMVVFIPLIPVMLLMFYYQSYAKNNILETHSNLAKMASSAMEQNIDNISWRLDFAKELPALLAKKNKNNIEDALNTALAANPDIIMFAILDKTGKEQYQTGLKLITDKIGAIDLTQDELLPYISDSQKMNVSRFDIQLGLPIAEIIYPLEDGNFLFAIVSFYRNWTRIETQKIGTSGRMYLVDTSGNIFMSNNRRQEQLISPYYLNQAILSEEKFQKKLKGNDGETYVGAIEPSPIEGAYIAVLQNKREAFSAVNSITAFLVFFMLAIAFLSYLAAFSFAGNIADPISSLVAGAKRISKGDFGTPVEEDTSWAEFNTLITSFNKMMIDLKNYQELQVKQQVSEMKEFVFKAVAHDLRAPVQGLEGYVDLLASGKFTKEEEKNYIEIMKISLADMLVSLENILDVSKFEAGILKTEKTQFSAKELIESVILPLKSLAEEKGLEINSKIESEVMSYGDKALIGRVLSNIISNAIKFTEKGGIDIVYKTDSKNSVFEITDSGIGIKENALEEIFDKYHQENNTIKGYGLGLAISKQIIIAHNGKIKAANAKNGGAVISFTLPLN